jgi:hypothetical protein
MKYRDRDYTSSDRSRRYRERKTSRRDDTLSHRDITQAEAEAEADKRRGVFEHSSHTPARSVYELPLIANRSYSVPEELFKTYAQAYEGINVMAELGKMGAWLTSNPLKRKTEKGMPRFMNSWLERAQNSRGGAASGLFSAPEPEPRRIKNTVGIPHD